MEIKKPHLPIVPVVDKCRLEVKPLPWPHGAFDPMRLEDAIGDRLEVIYQGLKKDLDLGWVAKLLASLVWLFKKGSMVDSTVDVIQEALKRQKLD